MSNIPIMLKLDCKRCLHSWFPRAMKLPKVCPHCSSPYWNKERVRKATVEKIGE